MMNHGACQKCGNVTTLLPLHGGKGGPLLCMMCAGAWHAEHSKKRKWGRIAIKAMNMYLKEGGRWKDLDRLKLCVGHGSSLSADLVPEYNASDLVDDDFDGLTSELLADTLQLVHPDKHPREREELARRVTQELLALGPFTFPKPKPKPVKPITPAPNNTCANQPTAQFGNPSRKPYPCGLCADTTPSYYCGVCKTEWQKEQQRKRDLQEKKRLERNAGQRQRYAARKRWRELRQPTTVCQSYGGEFKAKRQDAQYCSAACRQKAHRKRVTDGSIRDGADLEKRNGREGLDIAGAVAALLTTEPDDAFDALDLIDRIYPGLNRIEKKHRLAVIAAAKQFCESHDWDWCAAKQPGRPLVFFNRRSVMSYTVARLKADFLWRRNRDTPAARKDDNKALKAKLLPGGRDHRRVVEGGSWWRHVQLDVADLDGDDSPRITALRADQKRALQELLGSAP